MIRSIAVISLAALALAGCDKFSGSPAERAETGWRDYTKSLVAKATGPDISSPDALIKSYWKYREAVDPMDPAMCKYAWETQSMAYPGLFKSAISPELAAERDSSESDCEPTKIERTVDEVKSESETRSIVFATARQISPVPTKFYDAVSQTAFKTGAKLKYVTEKIDGKWRLSETYKFNDHSSSGGWSRIDEKYISPGFISTTVMY